MHLLPPMIEERMDQLRALCAEFGVARLEIFGSAATGAFDPLLSDLDFLVTYPPDYDFGPWLGRYFDLKERLRDLFRRRVDLVMAKEFTNPSFAQSVASSRRLLYAA